MNDSTKIILTSIKNILETNLIGLKLALRKSFKTMYSDKWDKEEQQINILSQKYILAFRYSNHKELLDLVNLLRTFLLIDNKGISSKISELNFRSFMNTSDGRFYGNTLSEFLNLINKVKTDDAKNIIDNPSQNVPNNRTINQTSTSNVSNIFVITHSVTGEKIQVAQNDLDLSFEEVYYDSKKDWNVAKRACEELGKGWRLPTKYELKTIYKDLFLKGIGNFQNSKKPGYISSSEYTNEDDTGEYIDHVIFPFWEKDDPEDFCHDYYIRAVKSM